MKFDNIIVAPCAAGSASTTDPLTCQPSAGTGGDTDEVPPVVVPPDDRCSDPAFYDAHPTICAGYPRLVIKPEASIVEPGKTVQYKTYVRTMGEETELTNGLAYSSSNPEIAVVSVAAGIASGVKAGITSISVTWQNLTAYAQIEVVESCSALSNQFSMVIDNSASMAQLFNSSYASKLSYARQTADLFIESINVSKDTVEIIQFSDAAAIVQAFTDNSALAKSAVDGIVSGTGKTNIDIALKTAIESFTGDGTRVIVLFTDGENTGPDPIARAKTFKESGGIIVVIGTRCWGTYFDLLYRVSSAGFFLSAYDSTADLDQTTLENLKAYLCSGDCPPTSGTYPKAQLDYNRFINWDVGETENEWPDLCGLGLYDVLPGNGLYVDMSGSKTPVKPAVMTSKVAYSLVGGNTYTFRIKVAGNNRKAPTGGEWIDYPIKITIGAWTTTVIPTSWQMPFTVYEFTFVPDTSSDENIVIEEIPADGYTTVNSLGTWIDDVYFEDTTADTVFIDDNFDSENPVTVPPGYASYGCISSPPGAQQADPNPPPTVAE